MSYIFEKSEIPEIILLKPQVFSDNRGYFLETYKRSEFIANGIKDDFLQDNISYSKKGVLRGLHYQLNPAAQSQIVRVVRGKVWDVVVDIRKNSSTFKKWVGVELNDENNYAVYMPPGFAHGFITLSNDVAMYYKCSAEFSPGLDGGIKWDDKDLDIKWPIDKPVISDKDINLPYLKDAILFN